jgi:membrane fusion protein (multidrug efflux system)
MAFLFALMLPLKSITSLRPGHGSTPGVGSFQARLTFLLAAATSVAALSCKKEQGAAQPDPPLVQVAELTATQLPISTEMIGQLDSPRNVEVRARVEAFVEEVSFLEGTEVQRGDVLFLLDKKPFQERLAEANGMLAEATAALRKYEKDVARLQPLAEKRAIPQQDLDNALASVDVGRASVVSAEAKVQSATLDLGYCEVRAPVTGLIGAMMVNVGELVGKNEPTLLATISTLDPIWFYCAIAEVQYLRAQSEVSRHGRSISDLPCTLLLTDGSEHPAKGKFVFIDRAVDPRTATLRVRAEFPNPEKNLRPGMFARVRVDLGTRADSIVIAERAVAELQGRSFVWVVDSENKASQRVVRLGEKIAGNLHVLEGLKTGERIIVEGLQKVREGLVVHPVTVQEMAQSPSEAEPKPAAN